MGSPHCRRLHVRRGLPVDSLEDPRVQAILPQLEAQLGDLEAEEKGQASPWAGWACDACCPDRPVPPPCAHLP